VTEFNLTESDLQSFERSYLRREDLVQARIYRVDHMTGMDIVGGRSGVNHAGWIAPNFWPGSDHPRSNTLRLDAPPLEQKRDGTIREKQKYRNEWGRPNLLYIPRGTPAEWLSDTSVEIHITEGHKKTLALWRLARDRRKPALCIGLSGGWNWRGVCGRMSDAIGERRDIKGPIEDLEKIAWTGRTVKIIFDTNAADNQSVASARLALRKELRERGAKVVIIDLPKVEGVNGVDDLLFIRGPEYVSELIDIYDNSPAATSPPKEKQQIEEPILRIVRMSDVEPEEVDWLWQPYIPLRKLTMLQGVEGVGKSWLLSALAAAVSCGRGLPDGELSEPGNVLLMSAEDGLGDTIRPRLEKCGADLTRVFALDEPLSLDEAGLKRLEVSIYDYKPVFVGIDPLFAYTGSRLDINRANECRSLSTALAAIAERHGCAFVMVRHLNKYRGSGDPARAGIGSVDWRAAVRSELLVGPDPGDATRRIVAHSKCNLAPLGCSYGYEIRNDGFFWLGKSNVTASDVLQAEVATSEDRSSLTDAEDFLRQILADGRKESRQVMKEAEDAGIPIVTLRRAQKRLGIKAQKFGQPGGKQNWNWELPEIYHSSTEDDQTCENDHLRATGGAKGS
jgi:hypothetical protein